MRDRQGTKMMPEDGKTFLQAERARNVAKAHLSWAYSKNHAPRRPVIQKMDLPSV